MICQVRIPNKRSAGVNYPLAVCLLKDAQSYQSLLLSLRYSVFLHSGQVTSRRGCPDALYLTPPMLQISNSCPQLHLKYHFRDSLSNCSITLSGSILTSKSLIFTPPKPIPDEPD
jgi:hypothetical protein